MVHWLFAGSHNPCWRESTYWFGYYFVTSDSMATTSSAWTCRNDECWKLKIVIQWPEKDGWIGRVSKRKNISLLSAPIKLNHCACRRATVDIEPVFSYSLQATSSDVWIVWMFSPTLFWRLIESSGSSLKGWPLYETTPWKFLHPIEN
jgi:hypothetical protein